MIPRSLTTTAEGELIWTWPKTTPSNWWLYSGTVPVMIQHVNEQ